jgi:hypothetical protein
MTSTRSHRLFQAASAIGVLGGLLLGACAPAQSAIDQAVGATRTADKKASDALSTALAGTLAAMPTVTSAPVSGPGPTGAPPPAATAAGPAQVCTENMADLKFLSSGYLEGGRFLITLQKPQGFQAQFRAEAYTLMVNGSPYACTQIAGNAFRIYCTGRPVPPVGQAQVQLLSADSSCTFEIPFQTVSVPPVPAPPSGGKY